MAGGLALLTRSGLGLVLSLGANVIVLRLLSLRDVGLFALASFFTTFSSLLIEPSLSTYLVRKPGELDDADLRVAQLFFLSSAVGMASILAVLALPVSGWYAAPDLHLVLWALLPSLLVNALSRVPMSLLERGLRYQVIATVELASSLVYYVVAIWAAYAGFGVWSLVLGDASRSTATLVGALRARPWRPGVSWDRSRGGPMLRYAASFFSSMTLWNLNAALAPVLVGRLAGIEALAVVRTLGSLMNQASSLKTIGHRLAVSALSRIQDDRERLRRIVAEGTDFQLLLGGLPLLALMSQGDWLVPLLFGEKWRAISPLLPVAAVASMVHSLFATQSAALYAIGKPGEVARFHAVYACVIWPLGYITVSHLGALGLPVAEVLVAPTFLVLHRSCQLHVGPTRLQGSLALLLLLLAAGLLARVVSPPALSSACFASGMLAVVLVLPRARHVVREVVRYLRERVPPVARAETPS